MGATLCSSSIAPSISFEEMAPAHRDGAVTNLSAARFSASAARWLRAETRRPVLSQGPEGFT